MLYCFCAGLGRCSYYLQCKWGLKPDQSYSCGAGVEAMEHIIDDYTKQSFWKGLARLQSISKAELE